MVLVILFIYLATRQYVENHRWHIVLYWDAPGEFNEDIK